jgi:hypothetical protein
MHLLLKRKIGPIALCLRYTHQVSHGRVNANPVPLFLNTRNSLPLPALVFGSYRAWLLVKKSSPACGAAQHRQRLLGGLCPSGHGAGQNGRPRQGQSLAQFLGFVEIDLA